MKLLYFDCFAGISGDMTLGALLDLGLDPQYLREQLAKLNLPDWSLEVKRCLKKGISANTVRVLSGAGSEHAAHGTTGHAHAQRHYTEIAAMIAGSGLSPRAKALAENIFHRLAVAEAKVHGVDVAAVHFHEVGAVDSIIDIVGTAILIDQLNVDRICSSVVNDGYGFIDCQHGRLPVPVPAVVEIFAAAKVRCRQLEIEQELVTPTGAAIIAELSDHFGPQPLMRSERVGYGAGTRELPIPGMLRVILGEGDAELGEEVIWVLECNVDDSPAELLGYTMERLLAAGAADVYFTPIQMKKNRPATKLSVLCHRDLLAAMKQILFTETTTIGLRLREERRFCLPRQSKRVQTVYGELLVKEVSVEGRIRMMPEYADAKKLAERCRVPLQQIYAEVWKIQL